MLRPHRCRVRRSRTASSTSGWVSWRFKFCSPSPGPRVPERMSWHSFSSDSADCLRHDPLGHGPSPSMKAQPAYRSIFPSGPVNGFTHAVAPARFTSIDMKSTYSLPRCIDGGSGKDKFTLFAHDAQPFPKTQTRWKKRRDADTCAAPMATSMHGSSVSEMENPIDVRSEESFGCRFISLSTR